MNQFSAPPPPPNPSDPFPDTWPKAETAKAEKDERKQRLATLKPRKNADLKVEPMEIIGANFDESQKAHIIKGIIAWGETSAWIAPPGGMKSALLASAAMSVALGSSWFGRRPTNPIGVVYFALERADLVKRRLIAHCRKLGLPDSKPLPIVVVGGMLDMMNPATVPLVVDAVRRAEDYFSWVEGVHCCGLLIFDTVAKMIAAGGGDENSAKDQGKVFANLQRIKDDLYGPHIALIGHTGKDETRGARGSNAIYGDVDVMVEIGGDTIKTATVTKANDAPEGRLFSFGSEIYTFGEDEDGDPITVNIVSSEEVSAQVAAKPEKRLSETQEAMYRLLHDAGPAGLSTDDWNAKARENGLGNRRATLVNVKAQLRDKGLVREYAGIWKVNNG
ncbi:AAA family ATPase [Bradyrhizobium sp. KB893862 SZCCT0404]|uniref:AAA family ATPase n=1 Tax=Bradyrhizobium sp. KB893862 SZCCT0404 TaxID=2807672 RepID=UPI001BA74610|nr:AAA family ATPase [Bradyrhizobium sp. KB893862 SZCCT0404]MBR1173685.1 AAA family ATPase [Bradyrhizobium sp. KB893862 SZCCT0404]